MSLVLLSEYKEILDITGNTEDEFVEQAQYEVESKVKSFLNRDLESASYVEIYDGTGESTLVLNQFPVNSVSKVEVYDGIDALGAEEWDEYSQNEDYERLVIPTAKDEIYLIGSMFPQGEQNIRITYNAGYDTIPYEIQQACKKLMLLYYGEVKKTKTIGKSSVSEGAGFTKTTTYDLTAEDRILKTIEKYRAWNV
jgi:hypothetical protein